MQLEDLRVVLLGAVFAFYEAMFGVRLVRAIRLQTAIRRGKAVSCSAEITDLKLRRTTGVRSVEAQYSVDGHEYTGQIVGMYGGMLSIGQTVSVIVDPEVPEVFALNEKHPRQAIALYAFCAAFPIFLVGVIILVVTFI